MWRKLESLFAEADGVVITSPENLRYFTGFTGGEGYALIFKKARYLLVDSRYTTAAEQEAKDFQVIEYTAKSRDDLFRQLASSCKCLYREDRRMTVAQGEMFKGILPEMEFLPLGIKLEEMRMVKTKKELLLLQKAEEIGEKAFFEVLSQIRPGVREYEIAAELEYRMRKMGAEGTSFETIVVSGKKTCMPHGKPDEKKIEVGDFVTMDFGCVYKGYCSDMTRTVAVGAITEEQKHIYQTVKEAQVQGLLAIRPGVVASLADQRARQVIEKAGFGAYFGHSLGHGVGLEIHELPNLSPRCETMLQPGMVVSCEPGIYIPNRFGVRIEDMVCVTENGIENFNKVTKDLLIL